MKKQQKTTLLVIFLLLAGTIGAGAWLWARQSGALWGTQSTAEANKAAYQTTAARSGDLALTISGSGKIVTADPLDLSFNISGTIAEVNVEVGDTVTAGQVLAVLDGMEKRSLAVQTAGLDVRKAEKALEDLTTNTGAARASVLKELAGAQAAYADAQANLHQPGDGRCASAKTQEYYFQWLYAQQRVDEWEGYLNDPDTGYGRDYILEKLAPLRKERDQAAINHKWCQSYTEAEIRVSEADLAMAEARLASAEAAAAALDETGGIDPQAVQIAEAKIKSARLLYEKARRDQAAATLTAPMDGTVMAVNAAVGDMTGGGGGGTGGAGGTGGSPLLTLANLDHPQVQVNIDETDLANFATGCAAEVRFDSLPNLTFRGVVSEIAPALSAQDSVDVVQGRVDLDEENQATSAALLPGLGGSVEITCQQVQGALVVPALALYDPSGEAYVYVLNADGQPEERAVEVGIITAASAEIRGGLKAGENVITSPVTGVGFE